MKEEREKFIPPKNDCEKCASLPEWRFCSQWCYYGSVFDYKWRVQWVYYEEASKYFNIPEDKKEEFEEFMWELIQIYY